MLYYKLFIFFIIKMEETFLKIAAEDDEFRKELKSSLVIFNNANQSTKAESAQTLFIQKSQLTKAMEIATDTIYAIGQERDHYLEKLTEYGDVDKEKELSIINYKIKKTEKNDKSAYVLKELSKQLKRVKPALKK